jgi:4-amino-4-deoxy-L-arabinose transferase-like glycosyltransferase
VFQEVTGGSRSETWGWRDYGLLAVVSAVIFGYALVGGRPFTMHEAKLPQAAKEMLAAGEWIVPTTGGRPWLERPPLPHWINIAVMRATGNWDEEWVFRLGSAAAGAITVLLISGAAARWYGRTIGLLTGLLLATSFEFVSYSWLAEDDIYLCAIVTAALVVFASVETTASEFDRIPSQALDVLRPSDGRFVRVLLFFLLVGATNFTKGLFFGAAMAMIPAFGFLVGNWQSRRWQTYTRPLGWLVFAVVAAAWPVAAYLRFPDVVDLWAYDHFGRLSGSYKAINQPWWYYLSTLPWQLAPWTALAILGIAATAKRAWSTPESPDRLVWLWAVLPVAFLSIPAGKHHHYLLHCMPAWSVLAARGLVVFWQWVCSTPMWWIRASTSLACTAIGLAGATWFVTSADPKAKILIVGMTMTGILLTVFIRLGRAVLATASAIVAVAATYFWIYTNVLPVRDGIRDDVTFLKAVRRVVPREATMAVHFDSGSTDVCTVLFYGSRKAKIVPHLEYLLDRRITDPVVYVVARRRMAQELSDYGRMGIVLESRRTRRETSPQDRLTLFRLEYDPDLPRLTVPTRVSPMQAIGREPMPRLRPLFQHARFSGAALR